MKIMTRQEAKARGLKHYFTGNPCKRGHIAPRLVCNKTCCECERIRKKKTQTVTKVQVVSVPKKQVRIVVFQVPPVRPVGKKRFQHNVISDKVVNLT